MSALLDHIEKQRCVAMQVLSVLEAIEALNGAGANPKVMANLLAVAFDLTHDVETGLTERNLPKGGDA